MSVDAKPIDNLSSEIHSGLTVTLNAYTDVQESAFEVLHDIYVIVKPSLNPKCINYKAVEMYILVNGGVLSNMRVSELSVLLSQ